MGNSDNSFYSSNVDFNHHTETPDVSRNREKYSLIILDKGKKVSQALAIGGSITTAALAAVTATGLLTVPVIGIAQAAAISLAGGVGWLTSKMELDSMVKASSDESNKDIANEISRGK